MTRWTLKPLAYCALATLLAATAAPAAAGEVLRVYNWSDYIAPDIVAHFEAETGIEVMYDTYESTEELDAALLDGLAGYDVVVPSSDHLRRRIASGRFRPLDHSLIPNWHLLDPVLMAQAEVYDPGNRHAVIYLWGTTGIGYNVAMVRDRLGPDAPVDSWDLILDPANARRLADCGITLLDSGNEVLPPVLKYLGFDPGTGDAEALEAAAAAVAAIRSYVRHFDSSDYIDRLVHGEACVSVGWSGDLLLAAERAATAGRGIEIAYSVPKEGTVLWFDMLAIPADAPNPEAAHAFIDFVLRPQNIAAITNHAFYPNAVPASDPYLTPEILESSGIYPPEDVSKNLFAAELRDPRTERALTRLWTRVRTGQ